MDTTTAAQIKKNGLQSMGIGGYIGYVILLMNIWGEWPLYLKIASVIGGIILFATVFYFINRLSVNQLKELAEKLQILLGILEEIKDTNPTPNPTPTPTPTPTVYPAGVNIIMWQGGNGQFEVAIIDKTAWQGKIIVVNQIPTGPYHTIVNSDGSYNVQGVYGLKDNIILSLTEDFWHCDKKVPTVLDLYNALWSSKTPLRDMFDLYGQQGVDVIIDPKIREKLGETLYKIAYDNLFNQPLEVQRSNAIKVLCAMNPGFKAP